eukprot:g641.t1
MAFQNPKDPFSDSGKKRGILNRIFNGVQDSTQRIAKSLGNSTHHKQQQTDHRSKKLKTKDSRFDTNSSRESSFSKTNFALYVDTNGKLRVMSYKIFGFVNESLSTYPCPIPQRLFVRCQSPSDTTVMQVIDLFGIFFRKEHILNIGKITFREVEGVTYYQEFPNSQKAKDPKTEKGTWIPVDVPSLLITVHCGMRTSLTLNYIGLAGPDNIVDVTKAYHFTDRCGGVLSEPQTSFLRGLRAFNWAGLVEYKTTENLDRGTHFNERIYLANMYRNIQVLENVHHQTKSELERVVGLCDQLSNRCQELERRLACRDDKGTRSRKIDDDDDYEGQGRSANSRSQVSRGSRSILLAGTCGAGKTVLACRLSSGSYPDTVSSMCVKKYQIKPRPFSNNEEATVEEKREIYLDKEKTILPCIPGVPGVDSIFQTIDFPGHGRFRNLLKKQLMTARSVIFLVDAIELCGHGGCSDIQPKTKYKNNNTKRNTTHSMTSVAELLYDILVNPVFSERAVEYPDQSGVLIVCNKIDMLELKKKAKKDVSNAASAMDVGEIVCNHVRSCLENELDIMRDTKSSLQVEGQDGDNSFDAGNDDDEDSLPMTLGVEGEQFTFARGTLVPVRFISASLKNGENMKRIYEFINHAME